VGNALPAPWQKGDLLQVNKAPHLTKKIAFIQLSGALCLMVF